jgi:flagellar biosynthesis chaperone FliJ
VIRNRKIGNSLQSDKNRRLAEIARQRDAIKNEIAKARLDGVKTQAWNEGLDRDIAMYKKEIDDKNKIISKSESEIRQRVLIIEHKQGQIDLYNKRIEQLIEKAGVWSIFFNFFG